MLFLRVLCWYRIWRLLRRSGDAQPAASRQQHSLCEAYCQSLVGGAIQHSTEWHRTVIVCYIKRGTVCYTRQYETQCLWLPEPGERLSGSRGPMWVEKSSISGWIGPSPVATC